MNIFLIILCIIIGIFIIGGIGGKIEDRRKKNRSDARAVPNTPLNNIGIGSGVAERILSKQFELDISWFAINFHSFLLAHFNEEAKEHGRPTTDLPMVDFVASFDFAIYKNPKDGLPSAFDTLVKASRLDDETGAIVQNGIVYAIARIITSAHTDRQVKEAASFAANLVGANRNTKSADENKAYMLEKHPRAAAIAEKLALLESEQAAEKVVAIMGYLIDLGDVADKDEKALGLRILDEEMLR